MTGEFGYFEPFRGVPYGVPFYHSLNEIASQTVGGDALASFILQNVLLLHVLSQLSIEAVTSHELCETLLLEEKTEFLYPTGRCSRDGKRL